VPVTAIVAMVVFVVVTVIVTHDATFSAPP
jgi:hypothetical protein